MTEDERERLARILEGGAGYSAGKPAPLALAAAQLRADGERIKALEEALTKFAAQQERLGPDFEAAIYANREGLYEE